MDDAEYKRLASSLKSAINAEQVLTNFKSRAGKAEVAAGKEYKEHKKDQPSWKLLAASLDKLDKLVGPTLKVILQIYDVGADKKKREKLSLADAKKELRDLMAKLQKMDDAAEDVLVSMAKVVKEVDKGDSLNGADLRAMQNYMPQFIEHFNNLKVDVNKLK
jgi:hypothetical protein